MSSSDEQNAVRLALHGIEHPVIVELGAHVGEEYQWLRQLGPIRYLMVEPDPHNCSTILRNIPHIELIEGAIAKFDGVTEFYSCWNSLSLNRASGSTHHPTGHLTHFPEVSFKPMRVGCRTLDSFSSAAKIYGIDLLWCDIQGAERDMIAGGRETLKRTRFMMIEAEPEVELYEGQALKPELIAMLPEWEIIKDFGYNLLMRNTEYK